LELEIAEFLLTLLFVFLLTLLFVFLLTLLFVFVLLTWGVGVGVGLGVFVTPQVEPLQTSTLLPSLSNSVPAVTGNARRRLMAAARRTGRPPYRFLVRHEVLHDLLERWEQAVAIDVAADHIPRWGQKHAGNVIDILSVDDLSQAACRKRTDCADIAVEDVNGGFVSVLDKIKLLSA
jgi:hypothetical protein